MKRAGTLEAPNTTGVERPLLAQCGFGGQSSQAERQNSAVDIITDVRYNCIRRRQVGIDELLKQKDLTKYRFSKLTGIPFATISDISTGKAKIEKCSAETVYKLAKGLGVTVEDLLEDSMERRSSFEIYKSNVCHMVKDAGDIDFIIMTLESDRIRKLFNRKWYAESMYLLAMIDYLSRENDLPVCAEYNDIRNTKLKETVYPAGIITMCAASHSDQPKQDSFEEAIPEFKHFNIVENEVRNVV